MNHNITLSDQDLEAIVLGAGACEQIFSIVNTYADPCV
jgi:hypothetical protein